MSREQPTVRASHQYVTTSGTTEITPWSTTGSCLGKAAAEGGGASFFWFEPLTVRSLGEDPQRCPGRGGGGEARGPKIVKTQLRLFWLE